MYTYFVDLVKWGVFTLVLWDIAAMEMTTTIIFTTVSAEDYGRLVLICKTVYTFFK